MASNTAAELDVELALDRIEAQLARELPAHMRTFAAAYAAGAPPPAAPDVAGSASTLVIVRRALGFHALLPRARALLRLAAPLAIERAPAVSAVRAQPPTWDSLAALGRARDVASRSLFGRGALDALHALHGARRPDGVAVVPPALAAWTEDDVVLDARAIEDAWRELARRHGIGGRVTVIRADVRPRAFVVEPARGAASGESAQGVASESGRGAASEVSPRLRMAGGEVIVVVPARIATPAARFALLHELGHALANLSTPAGLPRVLDEAVASYAGRLLEVPGTPWFSTYARAARARRTLLAQALHAIERGEGDTRIAARPPWALWHDPGAQATYVEAEVIADRLWGNLGASPAPGALAQAIAEERAAIDRRWAW
ncbi:MAG TPA: hypothetical protein VM513_11375 [Kofleriaceae bacterium]|nr:hypothetical protein [Kofleriaceae bacterium]